MLLATGGTIASQSKGEGLAPALSADSLLGYMPQSGDWIMEHENLMELDSSNMQPEQWRVIAQRVYAVLDDYDGVIITHGTDTMAYTASALGFMLQNLPISVVLTGSQLPIDDPLTDAVTNLYTAVEAVTQGIVGVTVAFHRKIINGTRAVKVSTMGFDAFESVNSEHMGRIFADGARIYSRYTMGHAPTAPARLADALNPEVFLLKLLPGTRPEIFDALADMGYRGIVLEAFGAGGLHYIGRDLLAKLDRMAERGVAVVICSQCLYEPCDLGIYEVGRKIMEKGVIPGLDMTTEAAATKLMWALGQTESMDELRRIFATSYAGEVNPSRLTPYEC